jgi:hypothetical protein
MIIYYVYRITNINLKKHYYGKRKTSIDPKLDLGIKYFSSSRDKQFIEDQKNNPHSYKYKIIKKFVSVEEATTLEIYLHNKFNVGKNPIFYNKSKQTSTKFDTTGISYNTPEMCEATSIRTTNRNKEKWKDPEYRTYMLNILHSPEVTKNRKEAASKSISEKNKQNWKDPEYRKKMSKLASETTSKRNKEKWKDPLYREHMKNSHKEWVKANPEKSKENARQGALASRKIVKTCPICNIFQGPPNVVGNHKKKCIRVFQNPKT